MKESRPRKILNVFYSMLNTEKGKEVFNVKGDQGRNNWGETSLFKVYYRHVFSSMSVAVLEYSNKKATVERGVYLPYNSKLKAALWGSPDKILKQLVLSHLPSRGRQNGNVSMFTCWFACAELTFSSHVVQGPLPREWSCPKWAGASHISYVR